MLFYNANNLHINTLKVTNSNDKRERFDIHKLELRKTNLAQEPVQPDKNPMNLDQVSEARSFLMSKNASGFFESKGDENTNINEVLTKYGKTSKEQLKEIYKSQK
ncbi:MAG: hypothetical protein ATN31_11550 [Candidatus Epulonipiscioides saccharophilum]|nr:MAG: hypothetical protein ATN31_11550 [Epulopiscium sp. AS2M-Bin001]